MAQWKFKRLNATFQRQVLFQEIFSINNLYNCSFVAIVFLANICFASSKILFLNRNELKRQDEFNSSFLAAALVYNTDLKTGQQSSL